MDADCVVLRPDDEAYAGEPCVGKRRENVVEKRPPDRDHSLHSTLGDPPLLFVQVGTGISLSHPGTEAASEDDRGTDVAGGFCVGGG
jgi:hypothetical protein